MKTKHHKDPFNTQCWLRECITDPYQVIATSLLKRMYTTFAGSSKSS